MSNYMKSNKSIKYVSTVYYTFDWLYIETLTHAIN